MSVRRALALVPDIPESASPRAWFCGHCAAQPTLAQAPPADARVCGRCGLGLLLETSAEVAPETGGAFVVLNRSLVVCAVSHGAEELLATTEPEAVDRHISELLVPADAEAQTPENLAVAVMWAARGDERPRTVVVRPANMFGVRMRARIAGCGPPSAALLVLEAPVA